MDNDKILVADDDADLLSLIAFALRNGGFDVLTATDGARALEALTNERFALAVLDINMPRLDGFAVCERLRMTSTLPVIMLSARSQEADILHALEIGADDYITKPFSPSTLLARVRALLRRATAVDLTVIDVGNARLDVEQRSLTLGAEQFRLTPLETSVLHVLFRHAGRLVAPDKLATEAWGRAGPEERHALKQVIYRLRRKLDDRTAHGDLLQTTRSAGYRWPRHDELSDASLTRRSL